NSSLPKNRIRRVNRAENQGGCTGWNPQGCGRYKNRWPRRSAWPRLLHGASGNGKSKYRSPQDCRILFGKINTVSPVPRVIDGLSPALHFFSAACLEYRVIDTTGDWFGA